jgi:hypothetical protein
MWKSSPPTDVALRDREIGGRPARRASLSDLDENDPASVARFMKKMGREFGDDLGDDFESAMDEAMAAGEDAWERETESPGASDAFFTEEARPNLQDYRLSASAARRQPAAVRAERGRGRPCFLTFQALHALIARHETDVDHGGSSNADRILRSRGGQTGLFLIGAIVDDSRLHGGP